MPRTVSSSRSALARYVRYARHILANEHNLLRTSSLGAQHHQFVHTRLRAPDLAGPAQELAHLRIATREWKDVERFTCGVKAYQRIGTPITDPDHILAVYIYRIGPWAAARETPLTPGGRGGVIHSHFAQIPGAGPEDALRGLPDHR